MRHILCFSSILFDHISLYFKEQNTICKTLILFKTEIYFRDEGNRNCLVLKKGADKPSLTPLSEQFSLFGAQIITGTDIYIIYDHWIFFSLQKLSLEDHR